MPLFASSGLFKDNDCSLYIRFATLEEKGRPNWHRFQITTATQLFKMSGTLMILFLVFIVVMALSLEASEAREAVKPKTVTKPVVELKLETISGPGGLTATYCTQWNVPSKDGITLTLSHSTNPGITINIDMGNQTSHSTKSGPIIDIDINNQTNHIVGSVRVQCYNGETKVTSSSDENFVHITPHGMQGTMIPSVRSWAQVPA
ncbi:hypothetical protein BKA61DRAFT_704651 [Leptodontidium sp. MPI-SDFR-AT-0119]|nr:hypothetical protein BKA61DRAFT_704651 [Leptodontidium sp. MPI-SDFR-AT-0119]